MMKITIRLLVFSILYFIANPSKSQNKSNHLVYVDKQGILRWTKGNSEASFFGVNYTTPFAYSYRAQKAMGIDLEKAIRQDVYQLARLGLDAFRVHVWDTEISDTAGNLLENDHLRLFDFLLSELEKRQIRIIITPIAFWGNGYPERDEITPGFSRKYGKGRATSNDTAIFAQENYLHQFLKHVNPYTKSTYGNDPNVIAIELNNEPSHSGPKSGVTTYINRLATAVRSEGWTKPVYYNIAQSPYYADAVAKAEINGVSFQWYPSGLVANQEVKGNFLPHVDHYHIPFDTIPEYHNKSKMVYEYDAADVLASYLYPAIARSFREAGFQWATQFAYDPTALAFANTEYQTHYLNLAYTPSKAISLMIASRVFHQIPRLKHFGDYPSDSVFDAYRVSYRNDLSEMNSEQEFYYSNSTQSTPLNAGKIQHLAGVGNSQLVQYEGTGAYFLDKISAGVWRLEVMPDAIHIRDPFERASPKKEVTRIQWQSNTMQIMLPDLNSGFSVQALDSGNNFSTSVVGNHFKIQPGTYVLTVPGKTLSSNTERIGVIGINEYGGPKSSGSGIFLRHEPLETVIAGRAFTLRAEIVGLDSTSKILVRINKYGGQSRTIPMLKESFPVYAAEVPADFVNSGVLNYQIILKKGSDFTVFPGNHQGDPFSWDNNNIDTWQTFVVPENSKLEIFDPAKDKTAKVYPVFKRGFQTSYIGSIEPGHLILKLSANELSDDHTFGFQYYFADKLKGRMLESFKKMVIKVRATGSYPVNAKITLINKDAFSFSVPVTLTDSFRNIVIQWSDLRVDSMLLLPRPYPGFQPLWFKASGTSQFKLSDAEKIEVTLGTDILPNEFKKPYGFEMESIWLE